MTLNRRGRYRGKTKGDATQGRIQSKEGNVRAHPHHRVYLNVPQSNLVEPSPPDVTGLVSSDHPSYVTNPSGRSPASVGGFGTPKSHPLTTGVSFILVLLHSPSCLRLLGCRGCYTNPGWSGTRGVPVFIIVSEGTKLSPFFFIFLFFLVISDCNCSIKDEHPRFTTCV